MNQLMVNLSWSSYQIHLMKIQKNFSMKLIHFNVKIHKGGVSMKYKLRFKEIFKGIVILG